MSTTALQVVTEEREGNVFAKTQNPAGGSLVEVGSQREIAEVQAAMVIAKRFPRDPIAAMDRILQACTRPTLAEGALYSYARGGSDITGPSIRLAEVAAQCWGNMQFGIREVEQRKGDSTVEAFAWDIEANTRQIKTFHVPHTRYTRNGSYKLEDPRDIYELVANNGARRLRACILGVIPGDVIEAAVKQCEKTLKATADVSPDGLKKLAGAFEQFGVTQAHIEKRCQCRLEAIRPAQVVQLKKVWASLRDGMSSPADWFEGVVDDRKASTDEATANLSEKLKQRAERARTPADPATTASSDDTRMVSPVAIRARLEAADSLDALNDAASDIELVEDAEVRKELTTFYTSQAEALA